MEAQTVQRQEKLCKMCVVTVIENNFTFLLTNFDLRQQKNAKKSNRKQCYLKRHFDDEKKMIQEV